MKQNRYYYSLIFSFLLCCLGNSAFSQITLYADSTGCGDTSTTIHATLIGDVPTASGITVDDGFSGVLPIGFTYDFYGTNYTNLLIGSNGCLSFNTSYAGSGFAWFIGSALLGNSAVYNCICGPWCDVFIPSGGTITYSTIGVAPNRRFAATWCATRMYSCTTQWLTTQIIIYETSNLAEVHIAHHTTCSWNGGYAIVGVQNSTGTAATAAPGRDFPSVWTATNEAWRFTPNSTYTSYSCTSIPFAPIPYASSTIYWYDSSTGAYLGSGSTLPVHPHVGTTYKATAAGCSDSTISYIHIDLYSGGGGGSGTHSPVHITSLSHTDPTECGLCNGTVTLTGLAPHQIDSIFYSIGGVAQPIIVDSAGTDSTLHISNLCDGPYDYFYVKVGPCRSNSIPVTLARPPINANFTIAAHPGCINDTIMITNLSTPPGYVSVWNYGDGTSLDSSASNPVHVFAAQGTYTVTLTYHNAYGCVDDTTAAVTFNHPIASVFAPSANAVCLGDPVTFTNTSVGNSATYGWDFGDGTGSTDMSPTHIYHSAGVYNVVLTVTDNVPCDATSNASIQVVSIDAKTAFHDTIVCLRDSMPLHTSVVVTPSSGYSVTYAWTPANNLSSAVVAEPKFFGFGDYTYTFTATTSPLGCVASDVETIHSKFPLALTHVTASQTIAYGSSIQLNADSALIYSWTPDDGTLDNANINDPIATPVDSVTVYTVVGMTTYGCRDTAKVTIRLNYDMTEFVPGAFTPNGDGLNDEFRPFNIKYQKVVEFRVFNRWGVEVFNSHDPKRGWDGRFNGIPQDLGVYYYTVTIANPEGGQKTYSGSVTLIR